MKKLGLTILGSCLLLGITAPIINAEARNSGSGVTHQSSSFHSVSWGHQGSEAFTAHTLRHQPAGAFVTRRDTGSSVIEGARIGQTAIANLEMGSNISRAHDWWAN